MKIIEKKSFFFIVNNIHVYRVAMSVLYQCVFRRIVMGLFIANKKPIWV